MSEAQKIILAAVISAAITAVAIVGFSTPTQQAVTPPSILPSTTNTEPTDEQAGYYTVLTEQLAAELEVRQALELEVEWLQSLLDEATASPKSTPSVNRNTTRPNINRELWFDDQSLLSLDIDETEIDRIKEVVNKAELDKLYLRNRATREGLYRGKNFRTEMNRIQQEMKTSLSEQEYDRMLYATGQNNRVAVSDTLTNSPAATAGIQAGDQILSYAGESIYQPTNLYQATTKGESGEMIVVEVLRDNERVSLYVPRGPLGTRFKSVRGTPQ